MKIGRGKQRVCPVERAGSLEGIFRKLIQNPKSILKNYVKEGMAVLDIGCGPGFFTVEIAEMVGKNGKVIAADLQQGMLDKIKSKIKGNKIEKRIRLHRCSEKRIGISEKVDFILAFYAAHEFPSLAGFFAQIKRILKPNGKILVVEPSFHVSKKEFQDTIEAAKKAGLKIVKKERVFLSRAAVFR